VSGIDPLAVMSARVLAAEAAMLEAAINLGVSAEVLQAQISTGDILAAKILPPQNGQDLIEILGQRVSAQLPPGVHPGETLLLQVTGFAGTQIYVRNLGMPDPRNPLPVLDVVLLAPENEPAPQEPPQTQPQEPAQPQAQSPPPVSPPRAVFVAASVQKSPAPSVPPAAQADAPAQPLRMPGIEARIAAAQAAKIPLQEKPDVAPLIPPRTPNVEATVVRAAASAAQAAGNAAQRIVRTVGDFLRAARLPDTPFTRMAATIAPHAPERLPSVLQRLEAALPKQPSDARISTLRTLIAFTARLNPANAETLPAQISAYVSNVIEGVEAKLAQLLNAHVQAAPQPQTQSHTAAQAHPHAPVQTQRPASAPQALQTQTAQDDAPQVPTTLASARAAERAAAVSHDLKSVVLSLLRDPPADRTPAMSQALSEALITLTGVQVNALSSAQQNPGTFTLTLPVYYREGGKPAQIRIASDAQSRAAKLDADNFHVAFVLDTAHLGTVAIDLQTTGRTVKVDVKTENGPAAKRFSETLDSLRGRLEQLRYRVASAVAGALPRASNGTATVQQPKVAGTPGLDLRA
jgi:hypothetical protein